MSKQPAAPIMFRKPEVAFGNLNASGAARLIAATSDIGLVLDQDGVIRDISFSDPDLLDLGLDAWIGCAWVDTVMPDGREKIEEMLEAARTDEVPRRRQVTHISSEGVEFPIVYHAMRVDDEARIIAVGRELRSVAGLQQRLIDAQLTLQRDYQRYRHVEARYRILFQMASEAVLIVDSNTSRIVEANPAAADVFGTTARKLAGRSFPSGFEKNDLKAVDELMRRVRENGRPDTITVSADFAVKTGKPKTKAKGKTDVAVKSSVKAKPAEKPRLQVAISLFRQDGDVLLLVRMVPESGWPALPDQARSHLNIVRYIKNAPDPFVLTGIEGRVIMANEAFLEITQLTSEERLLDQPLDRYVGRPGVDFGIMLGKLREYGEVRAFATVVRGSFGLETEVEVSCVTIAEGEPPCIGFLLQPTGGRLGAAPAPTADFAESPERFTELVGRVPLKDLVRETTDVIERMCIEAALKMTNDNRASAAEMLGLSRQSLYTKLRRYGLGDGDPHDEG